MQHCDDIQRLHAMPVKTKSNEIRLIRVFDAPVKTVWEAWSDVDQAVQWWGPRGFTVTNHSKELKTGGHWKYVMHGPDGVDYDNYTTYLEVEPEKKMVYDHGGAEGKKAMFRVTVTFAERDGKTEMDMTMACPTDEAAEQTRKYVKQANGDTCWDRLAEYLWKKTKGEDKFVINRSFPTSIDRMFEIWTDPKQLSKWMAPKGSTCEFIRADIRPGGSSFYSMAIDPNKKMYGKVEYVAIEKPNKLVYKQQFAEEAADQTRVTITWECHGNCSKEERETFANAKAGMTQGWTGSLDKLEEYLSQ